MLEAITGTGYTADTDDFTMMDVANKDSGSDGNVVTEFIREIYERGVADMIKGSMEARITDEGYHKLIEFIAMESDHVECPEAHELVVAAGELILNIFMYGYEKDREGEISIDCLSSPETHLFQLTIRDNGKPFDPAAWGTDSNIRVITTGAESKGIGILIAKRYLSDIQYEYKDGQNILTVLKRY